MSVITVNGGKPLSGRVHLKGAKNLVTKAMVAALLADSPSVLKDVPKISDVEVVSRLLELHGVSINFNDAGVMELDPRGVKQARMVDIDAHAGSSRIPILFCGPLLHQLGEAFIPDLGGCHIGGRPVDFHLDVLRKFGAVIEKSQNGTRLSAPNGLHGAKLSLPYPSVGATEQVLLTSVRAKGLTELSGAAIEPEIMDLIAILQKMGAIISVDTDRTIRIEGVGGGFDIEDDGIRFYQKGEDLHPVVIETDVHPGFMTDWQQPLVVALTQAKGLSIVHETVYENRFGFTDALVKMGAQIQIYRECLGGNPCRFGQMNFYHSAVISGPTALHGADIVVPDLRGGFSHMVAALTAKGVSNVSNAQLISRGYEHFLEKLSDLGADFSYAE